MNDRDIENTSYESMLISALLQSGELITRILSSYQDYDKIGLPWFTSPKYIWITDKLIKFCSTYSADVQAPSTSWLMKELEDQVEEKYVGREECEEEKQEILTSYRDLIEQKRETSVPIHEAQVWIDELIRVARNRAIVALMADLYERTRTNDFDGVLEQAQKALPNLIMPPSEEEIRVSDIFEDIGEIIEEIRDRRDNPDKYAGWMTGIERLDEEMGGLMGGELGMVAGLTGFGKSGLIRDIGLKAAYQGARVCYISAEVRMEMARMQLLSRMSELPYQRIKRGQLTDKELDWLHGRVDEIRGDMPGQFDIIDVPQDASTAVVKSALARKFRQPFDMYLFDHLGLMTLSTGSKEDRFGWKIQTEIAEEIRVFSRKEKDSKGKKGVACWMAVQGKPDTDRKSPMDIKVTDIGLAYPIAWGLHCAIHIVPDSSLNEVGEALLKITKVRDGQGNFLVKVKTALWRCHFLYQQENKKRENLEEEDLERAF